jgi:hypothetical protein
VPEGDWFCPGCCSDIKACSLSSGAAVACVSLLLLSDSGRQLLGRQGLLQHALPLVQQEAAAAAAAAQAALASAAEEGQADEAVSKLVAGLRLGALHVRAGMHALAASIEEQPAALAEGEPEQIVCMESSAQKMPSSCLTLPSLVITMLRNALHVHVPVQQTVWQQTVWQQTVWQQTVWQQTVWQQTVWQQTVWQQVCVLLTL